MSTPEDSARPVPDRQLPSIHTLGRYDGPIDSADRRQEAALLATARCALHPLYKRSPGDCLTLLYRAQALNIPVGIALDHVYINTAVGKAGLTAQLMAALLQRAGITWQAVKLTDQVVELKFKRGRKVIGTEKWEIREASRAGLTRRAHWQLWPVDCLWARAMARSCRRFFSDIVMGMGYTPEELHDMDDPDAATEGAATVDPAVQEFLDQAATEGTTADQIRGDIIPRAKKAKLLKVELPDGRTLEQALNEQWLIATGREAAIAADAALVDLEANAEAAAAQPVPDPAASAPVGAGKLPCDCDAAAVASTGDHQECCRDRAAALV